MKRRISSRILTVVLSLVFVISSFITVIPAFAASNTKTSYDFFKSVGATKACEILDSSKQKSHTRRGNAGDATNLENMYKSLDTIDETNKYRAKENLPALKVTDAYMAMAQINVNYATDYYKSHNDLQHNKEFLNSDRILDNLAGNQTIEKAVAKWYAEKSSNGGHYTAMVGKNSGINSNLSGAAINTSLVDSSSMIFINETFGTTNYGETSYTVDQYRKRLKKYMDSNGTASASSTTNSTTSSSTSNNSTPLNTSTTPQNTSTNNNNDYIIGYLTQEDVDDTKASIKKYNNTLAESYIGNLSKAYLAETGKIDAVLETAMIDQDTGEFQFTIYVRNGSDKPILVNGISNFVYSDRTGVVYTANPLRFTTPIVVSAKNTGPYTVKVPAGSYNRHGSLSNSKINYSGINYVVMAN